MVTSSNGNIFRVTGHLCGEFTGPGEFPTQSPVTRSFDVFFDLRLNKRLRYRAHYDVIVMIYHSLGIMCEQDDFDYTVLFSAQQHIKPPEATFTNMV